MQRVIFRTTSFPFLSYRTNIHAIRYKCGQPLLLVSNSSPIHIWSCSKFIVPQHKGSCLLKHSSPMRKLASFNGDNVPSTSKAEGIPKTVDPIQERDSISVGELNLKVGDFLLIKRYARIQPCIVANLHPLSSLLENGALIEHNPNDIYFHNVMSQSKKTMTPRELKRMMVDVNWLQEAHKVQLSSIYSEFHHKQKRKSISIKELVEFIFPNSTESLPHILAVLLHCIEDSIHFKFTLQGLRENREIHFSDTHLSEILAWLAEIEKDPSQHSIFRSFVEKCARVLKSNASATDVWSENDLRLIQALKDFVIAPKEKQRHYLFISTFILKPLGYLYLDPASARALLIQIGFCHPYENFTLISNQIHIEGTGHTETDTAHQAVVSSAAAWTHPENHATSNRDPLASRRIDLGHLPVYTIDGRGAAEIDDGISIEFDPQTQEPTWVHIHVADPSSYLPFGHPIVGWAKKRVAMLFFPEKKYPMLPPVLSQERYSLGAFLKQNQERNANTTSIPIKSAAPLIPNYSRAMTFSAKFNTEGEILDYQLRPTILRNIISLEYDNVDAFLGTHRTTSWSIPPTPPIIFTNRTSSLLENEIKPLPPSVHKDILALNKLAQKLIQKRREKGALNFNKPRPHVSVELPSDFTPLFHRPLSQSHFFDSKPWIDVQLDCPSTSQAKTLVAEFMILAGRIGARYAQEHRLVMPYRGQLSTPFSTTHTGGSPFAPMLPSYFSGTPVAHVSMGLSDGYVRVTSPLRRYLDLFCHYQFQQSMLGLPPLPFDNMEGTMYQEGFLRKVQMQREIWWVYYLLHLHRADPEKRQTIYRARVHKTPEFSIQKAFVVSLVDLGVKGVLMDSAALTRGDWIHVQVKEVDPYLPKLELRYVGRMENTSITEGQ